MDHKDFITIFISILALGVSIGNLCVTRKLNLRPLRIQAYILMKEFMVYCASYLSEYSGRQIEGTRELWSRLDSYKWEMEKLGPLGISNAVVLHKELERRAKLFQRELERMNILDQSTAALADSQAHELAEWFHNEQQNLKKIFEPYIK